MFLVEAVGFMKSDAFRRVTRDVDRIVCLACYSMNGGSNGMEVLGEDDIEFGRESS